MLQRDKGVRQGFTGVMRRDDNGIPDYFLFSCKLPYGVIFKSWQEVSHSLPCELKNLCRNFLPVLLLEEIEPITQNLKTRMIVDDLMILYLNLAEQ